MRTLISPSWKRRLEKHDDEANSPTRCHFLFLLAPILQRQQQQLLLESDITGRWEGFLFVGSSRLTFANDDIEIATASLALSVYAACCDRVSLSFLANSLSRSNRFTFIFYFYFFCRQSLFSPFDRPRLDRCTGILQRDHLPLKEKRLSCSFAQCLTPFHLF